MKKFTFSIFFAVLSANAVYSSRIAACAEKTVAEIEPEPVTVKCKIPSEWTNGRVFIHAWNGGISGGYPTADGITAEVINCETWYSYTFPSGISNFDFLWGWDTDYNLDHWNGDGNQCGDITGVASSTCVVIKNEYSGSKRNYEILTNCPVQTVPLFKVAGNFNNWSGADMAESGIAGVWKYTTTLAAGDYEFKILHRTGSCSYDWPFWWEANRIFTLAEETEVNFYSKEDNCNGVKWVFFCDAQDLYLVVNTQWDSKENPLTKEDGFAHILFTAPNTESTYQIRVPDNSSLIDNDIMQCAGSISGGKKHEIAFDYETMSVSVKLAEFDFVGNPYVYKGNNPENTDFYDTESNFNGHDFETVAPPFYIGGEIQTNPVKSPAAGDNISARMYYQVDSNAPSYVELTWVENVWNGIEGSSEQNSKWRNATGVNIFEGLSLDAGAHTLTVWFEAVLNGNPHWVNNSGNSYTANFNLSSPITTSVQNIAADNITAFSYNNTIVISANEKISKIALYSIAGQTVFANDNVSSLSYNINNAKSGVYILKIFTANNTYSQKVVVR
ncbi:MAG: T9SS type A sorting domain-containing protein [Prevotellaceae bacterium]|jgi:hypothetical protein|nr:T9SS type A sorting domain-containing protein [Prevotellaceae bacterium]